MAAMKLMTHKINKNGNNTDHKSERLSGCKDEPTVRQFMSVSPHTIGNDQKLERAHETMRKYHIRHLPVLKGGKLVGVVSQRDLYLVEAIDPQALFQATVDEAMSQEVFEVSPNTALREVVREMVETKYGCAIVSESGKVIGIFTTVDGLRALLENLA